MTRPTCPELPRVSDLSRRSFLQVAGAATATALLGSEPLRDRFAYVGCYSLQDAANGSTGNGGGIYLLQVNSETGALTPSKVFPDLFNPTCLALNSKRDRLYVTHELTRYRGAQSGSVSAYAIDRASGELSLLNTVSSEGAEPAYVSVHPSSRWVFVANYTGGNISAFPILENGNIGTSSDSRRVKLPIGASKASGAPEGSFAISGHDQSHAHMILADRTGRHVLSTDLGADQIFVWGFDAATGKFSQKPAAVALPSGDGPRHFCFHPNNRWLYSLQEEASTISLFEYQESTGSLKLTHELSSLPRGFKGSSFASEIKVARDGRFLYAANRLHDSISYFAIGDSGKPVFAGEEWTRGDYPNSFEFSAAGTFLYSCNTKGDSIATFSVNRATGRLKFTDQYTAVGSPSVITFI